MNWHCYLPVKVIFKSLDELKRTLEMDFSGLKVTLLLSETSEKRSGLAPSIQKLKEKNSVTRISRISPNPTPYDVCRMLELIGKQSPDLLICIGGGSVIDSGKALSLFHHSYCRDNEFDEHTVVELLKTKSCLTTLSTIPFIAVPTTAGAGSEATKWATIWDLDSRVKYSIETDRLYPQQAWIVPELTRYMPKRLTLSTGLDALCQAVESYWSKNSNEISREFSLSAISIITKYLPAVLKEPDNASFRHKMCLGSLFSAFAFSNTRTTACHSISYPLTMLFGVEHGFAAALTLFSIAKINQPEIKDVDRILNAWGVNSIDGIKAWLDGVCTDIQPLTLSAFGIEEKNIPDIVELAFTQGRMDNNPVKISPETVLMLLKELK